MQGAVPDIFPGPLVPVSVQRNIDDEGVQAYLGPEEPFEFDSYLIMASVTDEALVADVPGSVIVDWPGEIGLRLADAGEYAELPADDDVVDVFTDVTQVTWFEDDGDIYRVAATPRLPGRSC